MIDSRKLERQLLSGLMQYPSTYSDIVGLIDESDFYTGGGSFVHATIFKIIKKIQENGHVETLDQAILSERLKSYNISFIDNINIDEYLSSLLLIKVSKNSVIEIAKELKTYSARLSIIETCTEISKEMRGDNSHSLPEIISKADQIYNDKISFYSKDHVVPENIYDDLEDVVEDLADNPEEPGMMAPDMPYLNRMYGSLLVPGNVTVICARTGVGKTTFCLDFVTKVSAAHENIPILHFDNGEMSKLELQMRQCSAMSGVPMYLIQSGKWRSSSYIDPNTRQEVSAEQAKQKVRKAFKDMKDRRFDYFNVGGLSVDEMIQVARRYYYSKVGRGNKMILSFDYIKPTNEKTNKNKASWELIGEMVDKFKRFIHKDVVFNNRQCISMITSVQSNRSGITGNRNPDAIIDDESIVSLSDQITQFASHLFLLRPRVPIELQTEPDSYSRATHRLKCIKNRTLGEDRLRATEPVLIPSLDDNGDAVGNNRVESNAILLRIDNFCVEEIGDLRDMADQMRVGDIAPDEDGDFTL